MSKKLRPVEFDMSAAVQAIEAYCVRNGLVADKIDRFQRVWDIVAALKESGVKSNGLCNDMETMPYVVLYYDIYGAVHETEHTHLLKVNRGGTTGG